MDYTDILNYNNGCKHYKKNCKIYAECCKKWYNCRICHNVKTNHLINRKHIKLMKCDICDLSQIVSNLCKNCKVVMATYHCYECNLFDSDGNIKNTFHCKKCNICRTGGEENFIHCNLCNHCIDKKDYDNHICLDSSIKSDCPICLINMNNCNEPLKILLCGHSLHNTCYNEYKNSTIYKKRKMVIYYKCPICRIVINNSTDDTFICFSNNVIDLANDVI